MVVPPGELLPDYARAGGKVNLDAPLLGGGFVTERRGKPCSYMVLMPLISGRGMARSRQNYGFWHELHLTWAGAGWF